jgi:ribonuclease D
MHILNKEFSDLSNEEFIDLYSSDYIAIDTETTGLNALSNKLCTIQLANDKIGFLIRYDENKEYSNLRKILFNKKIVKIFHNAVFDVNFLMTAFNEAGMGNIVCTKIGSKILNGVNYDNTLKGLTKEYLNFDMSKQLQLSNWNSEILSKEQIDYAMNDVKYLYDLWICLQIELKNRGLEETALKCFEFIPVYIKLYNSGIDNIFKY